MLLFNAAHSFPIHAMDREQLEIAEKRKELLNVGKLCGTTLYSHKLSHSLAFGSPCLLGMDFRIIWR